MTKKLKIGQRVQAQRTRPPKGTWKLFDGKKGTVKVLPTKDVNEYGVQLDGSASNTWFLVDELVAI